MTELEDRRVQLKIITLFPELIRSYLGDALIAKALNKNLLSIELIPLRDFSDNSYKSVDEAPFGGGDGMLIRADILEKALLTILDKAKNQKVIYFTPQGKLFTSAEAQQIAQDQMGADEIILICGRYAGVDQRFIDQYVDEEWSIGDYVLSGGEIPALVVIEAVSRFVPGVLGQLQSAEEDSLQNQLLEAPQYTRPQVWNEQKVPDVLLSGDHKKIKEWKQKMALEVTQKKRPDLLKKRNSET
ncbi:tRNA (guanosine(37)-N1)-methyltransferase TrmD [Pseudobdellovibrio exovorus]|uniref:tRNA (guanine-N(1)-)-methyltransferase n=1 Tax=Pseudobdellovibrio exovorus JSS TaxID=1184267 RepID=M4V8F9_9BACT|nr:tRNA (guanosine(37)-N1)-methyltransferase TrmD [Pseudobdellovibrio exovorus]AGH95473.1 tRNA methyltransferase [Pseudobdellovibrio exovorus JSS]